MSDPAFLTLDFARNLPKTMLTDIGAGIRSLSDQQNAMIMGRNNQIAFNEALSQYMANPNEGALVQLYNAAAPLGRTDEIRSTVAEVQQIRAAREAANLQRKQVGDYQDAWDAYMETQSPDNLRAVYDAAQPLGLFDQAQKTVAEMTTNQRIKDVREMMDIFAPLANGQTEMGIEAIDRAIAAYEAEGNMGEVNSLRNIKKLVQEGKIKEATAMLSAQLGLYDEGQAAMDNWWQGRGEERAQTELGLEIFSKGAAVELSNDELMRMQEAADADPEFGEIINRALDYTRILREGGDVTPEQISSLILDLNKRFYDRTTGLQDASLSNQKLQDTYRRAVDLDGGGAGTYKDPETGEEFAVSGMADLALIQIFQRQIDEATVRESDIQNILATVGGESAIQRWFTQIFTGQKLAPEQRAEIAQLSEQLLEAQRDYVDNYVYPSIEAMRNNFNSRYGAGTIPYEAVYGEFVRPEERAAAEAQAGAITRGAPSVTGTARGTSPAGGRTPPPPTEEEEEEVTW